MLFMITMVLPNLCLWNFLFNHTEVIESFSILVDGKICYKKWQRQLCVWLSDDVIIKQLWIC